MCYIDDGAVRLISRRGNDLTRLCPAVSIVGKSVTGPAVLDGEIVAFRDRQQSFEALQTATRRQAGVNDGAFLALTCCGSAVSRSSTWRTRIVARAWKRSISIALLDGASADRGTGLIRRVPARG
jgi:hypothetical protein